MNTWPGRWDRWGRPGRWGRLGRAVAAGLGIAVLLAGCGLPSGGEVHVERQVPAGRMVEQPVQVLAPLPYPGEQPRKIVQGFLLAQSVADDDHAVARHYLTEEAAQEWDDDAHVVIYSTEPSADPSLEQVAPSVFTTTVRKVATLEPGGAYVPASSGAEGGSPTLTDRYELTQINGEWRLSSVPQGLRLTRFDVDRLYDRFATYFLAPGRNTVVPDPVFVPNDPAGQPTALVRALLDGPSDWLAPVVDSAAPSGTELLGATVVRGGVAEVNLSAEVEQASVEQRERLAAQLVWTLRQLGEVTKVRLLSEGRPLVTSGDRRAFSRNEFATYDPAVLGADAVAHYMQDGVLRSMVDDAQQGEGLRLGVDVAMPAVSIGGDWIAGLVRRDGDREDLAIGLLQGESPMVTTVLAQADLTEPSWGPFTDAVWVVRRDGGQRVLRVSAAGAVERVSAEALVGLGRVETLRISRDGTRAVAIVRDAGATRLVLLRVRIEAAGTFVLEAPRPIRPELAEITDVAWNGADEVLVVARVPPEGQQVYSVPVDGSSIPSRRCCLLTPPEHIAAGGADLPAVTQVGDEIFAEVKGGGWTRVADGVQPAYPG